MRKRILELLRENGQEPLSGEDISKKLNITRTAVWKHIQTLKSEGYEIESLQKRGYILRRIPDRLFPQEIASCLKTKWLGRNICYQEKVDSTNNFAKKLANDGCKDGLLVVAEEQGSGKGRLSRGWISPYAKGIWFSVVLKPPFLPQEASKCTLLAAVAVVKAVNNVKGLKAAIKWPNDILLNGRKLVGILTEMNAEFGHINYVVIGIGINTHASGSDYPPEVRDLAISVADAAKSPFRRVEILAAVLKNMEELYERAIEQGFVSVLDEWRKYSCTLGEKVKVIAPERTYLGTAVDIDNDGLLLVKTNDGHLEKVVAGDVSIRPAKTARGMYQ